MISLNSGISPRHVFVWRLGDLGLAILRPQNIEGKQSSLFPLGPVINEGPNLKFGKKVEVWFFTEFECQGNSLSIALRIPTAHDFRVISA